MHFFFLVSILFVGSSVVPALAAPFLTPSEETQMHSPHATRALQARDRKYDIDPNTEMLLRRTPSALASRGLMDNTAPAPDVAPLPPHLIPGKKVTAQTVKDNYDLTPSEGSEIDRVWTNFKSRKMYMDGDAITTAGAQKLDDWFVVSRHMVDRARVVRA